MNITQAQYTLNLEGTENSHIRITMDGKEFLVPLDPANSDYAEIMRQVEAGELTIQEAE